MLNQAEGHICCNGFTQCLQRALSSVVVGRQTILGSLIHSLESRPEAMTKFRRSNYMPLVSDSDVQICAESYIQTSLPKERAGAWTDQESEGRMKSPSAHDATSDA